MVTKAGGSVTIKDGTKASVLNGYKENMKKPMCLWPVDGYGLRGQCPGFKQQIL